MTTGLDLVKSVMKKAGVLTKTESPSSDEAVDCLEAINDLLDSWANDGLYVPSRTLEGFPLSANVATYTIGSGGTFNTVKPVAIISSYVRDGTTDNEVIIITDEEYAALSQKATTGIPEKLNFTNAYPLSTIRLYPVPAAAYTIYLLSEKQATALTLSGTVYLPVGWKRALTYNAAIEIAPEYGQSAPQETVAIAADSINKIRLSIARNRKLDKPTEVGEFDILTGYQ